MHTAPMGPTLPSPLLIARAEEYGAARTGRAAAAVAVAAVAVLPAESHRPAANQWDSSSSIGGQDVMPGIRHSSSFVLEEGIELVAQ